MYDNDLEMKSEDKCHQSRWHPNQFKTVRPGSDILFCRPLATGHGGILFFYRIQLSLNSNILQASLEQAVITQACSKQEKGLGNTHMLYTDLGDTCAPLYFIWAQEADVIRRCVHGNTHKDANSMLLPQVKKRAQDPKNRPQMSLLGQTLTVLGKTYRSLCKLDAKSSFWPYVRKQQSAGGKANQHSFTVREKPLEEFSQTSDKS